MFDTTPPIVRVSAAVKDPKTKNLKIFPKAKKGQKNDLSDSKDLSV